MKFNLTILCIFIVLNSSLFSFEIVEKKFKNNVQFDFFQKSGGSFNDINGDNQTELTRYDNAIRYNNGQLSPINYIFERKDRLFNISGKYFLYEALAVKAKMSSTLLSMTQREFFYDSPSPEIVDQKIAYNLDDKSEFIIDNYQFGIEYYFLKGRWITAFTGYYAMSGINENVNYSTQDSTDLERIQNHVTLGDSILIHSEGFSFATPNIISFGGLAGYNFKTAYIELASNYELRTDGFANQVVSHLGFELNNNDIFKIKAKLQYTDIIGELNPLIPYRPFRANPQIENLNANVGFAYIKDNIYVDITYGQTIYAKNSLNWGQVSFSLAYLF